MKITNNWIFVSCGPDAPPLKSSAIMVKKTDEPHGEQATKYVNIHALFAPENDNTTQ